MIVFAPAEAEVFAKFNVPPEIAWEIIRIVHRLQYNPTLKKINYIKPRYWRDPKLANRHVRVELDQVDSSHRGRLPHTDLRKSGMWMKMD